MNRYLLLTVLVVPFGIVRPVFSPLPGGFDGLGVATLDTSPGKVLHLYSQPALWDELPGYRQPEDSLVFVQGEHHVELSAKADLTQWEPLHRKLDYGIFYVRVTGKSRHWLEIIVDETKRESYWADATELEYQDWATVLLTVNSVERIDRQNNPLRERRRQQRRNYVR